MNLIKFLQCKNYPEKHIPKFSIFKQYFIENNVFVIVLFNEEYVLPNFNF